MDEQNYQSIDNYSVFNTTITPGNFTLQAAEDCFDGRAARTAKITACIAVLVVTILLNTLVIYPVYKYKRMRKNINYFIINMAVSDILLASLTNTLIAEQMISGTWNWKIEGLPGRMTCRMVNFMCTMLLLVSPLTLFFMTLERYRGVTSMTRVNGMSYSTRSICLSMCWIIPSILYAVELFRVDLHKHQGKSYCVPTDGNNPHYFNYLVALFTTYVFLYISVFLIGFQTLRKLSKSEGSVNVSEARQRKRRSQKIRSAVRMIQWSLCAFVLLSTPYHMFVFFDKLYPQKTSCKKRINLMYLFRYLISLNSALSPCIYFIFIKDFRRFFRGVSRPLGRSFFLIELHPPT
ncbi:tachykinin-like peptides receptor 86C [Actinia tenebrosa]|uniref:Tachykinin-like peptides receptor 86C n=1 Tax=Actinia tenebrosa TaxID=6105 RepID=A0A6P8J069_ACTTE|nr:tachykinin-like peptides receptor 86C [Actinia tenebrosa]